MIMGNASVDEVNSMLKLLVTLWLPSLLMLHLYCQQSQI